MKRLHKLKQEADEIFETDNTKNLPLSGIAERIAKENLMHNNFYSYEQEGKKKLIILIHI